MLKKKKIYTCSMGFWKKGDMRIVNGIWTQEAPKEKFKLRDKGTWPFLCTCSFYIVSFCLSWLAPLMGFPGRQVHLGPRWMLWVFCVVCCGPAGSTGVVLGTRTGLWTSSDLCFRLLLTKLYTVMVAHPENLSSGYLHFFLGHSNMGSSH